ncbi:MAG: class I poly(R)-hydroxyalkanoic acid synthase [Alphaproteobacteria bacterium]|nr:class I poly(R)-hydroxyalkanoic acid synthase [Alphaproteobacteria bacterium]
MPRTPKKPHKSHPHAPEQPVDAEAFANNMARASDIWQRVVQALVAQQLSAPTHLGHSDPVRMAESALHLARNVSIDPERLMQAQLGLVQDHLKLWQWWAGNLLGKEQAPYVEASPKDRRFSDPTWTNSTFYDFIKQHYLVNARWLQDMVGKIDGLSDHERQKLGFFTRQFIDATAPSNFALTNPEVMRALIDTNGESMVAGLHNLLKDIEKGEGGFRISMTDESAFTLGKNIATTPGSVVYENDLMQLIQYAPTTAQVYTTPLLLVPAWINKYYIFDLTAERSFIHWLTQKGYTVFVVSWVNPDEKLGRKSFEDYLREGPLAALDIIETICGVKQTALIGYCLGGTLSAIALSYLQSLGEDARVASITYLTTLVDFAQAGELSVFIDDSQLEALENRMSERGYLDGGEMATTFNMLRANDLIWSFVVNNYLLGKQPFPFDLLYWNADSTRMPATMHAYYLRNMYQRNLLIRPGGITLLDTPINLSKITTPSYILATREDHIAPWMSAYVATQTYDGEVVFTLADSGHIAGVVNPPAKQKYCYWTNSKLPRNPEDWLKTAKQHPGSWWEHWHAWQSKRAGKKIAARKKLGNARYKPIEPAPGRYAKVKA